MQWFPDIMSILKDNGVFAVVSLVLIYFIGRWVTDGVREWLVKLKKALSRIDVIHKSIVDPIHRDEIIYRQAVIDAVDVGKAETFKMIDEALQKHCSALNCPVVSMVSAKVVDLQKGLDRVMSDTSDLKKEVIEVTQAAYKRVNQHSDDLNSAMLDTLKHVKKGSNNE